MTSLFSIYSCLLSYPEAELLAALTDIEQALAEQHALTAMQPVLTLLQGNDLISLQENYVATFDRNPSHSLHLFEHVHGEYIHQNGAHTRRCQPLSRTLHHSIHRDGLFHTPLEL